MLNEIEPAPSPKAVNSGRSLLLRGLEVRLRFLVALLGLGGLAAGWPYLRTGWELMLSHWHSHRPSAAVSGDTEFFCPMDPGVVSAWPAICPICNMDLISRKKSDAVLLPEGVLARMQLTPYRIQLAGIRTVPLTARKGAATGDSLTELIVPESAVVTHGSDRLVYVETMPGMFDGVRVQLGPRDGDGYPVISGVQAGQRVAVAGAFLIDAESRLNPNLATQYFGANPGTESNRVPPLPQRKTTDKLPPLSKEELALVERQAVCPVTDAPLGSMGRPTFVMVQGRKIFLCCRGCEAALLAEPDKYLTKLDGSPADHREE